MKGFTLFEVLVSAALSVALAVGVFSLFRGLSGISITADARLQTEADLRSLAGAFSDGIGSSVKIISANNPAGDGVFLSFESYGSWILLTGERRAGHSPIEFSRAGGKIFRWRVVGEERHGGLLASGILRLDMELLGDFGIYKVLGPVPPEILDRARAVRLSGVFSDRRNIVARPFVLVEYALRWELENREGGK